MKEITVLGIDLAKDVFHLCGIDPQGRIGLRKKLRRTQLERFMANAGPSVVGMEACGGAFYWARAFEKMGHEVRLVPVKYVKPYVKTNKNDWVDAEAICKAITRPNMRFVKIKPVESQDIQSLHRVRQRWVRQRTAICSFIGPGSQAILHRMKAKIGGN